MKLVAAFKILIKQTAVPLKLCLLIDGLDEYEGEHEEMTNLFKEVTSLANVKARVSSRPWLVFQDCFSTVRGCDFKTSQRVILSTM